MKPTVHAYLSPLWVVALTSLTGMVYELLVTRIFSVVMWYHFASLAIALAMLGIAFGALATTAFPPADWEQRTKRLLLGLAAAFLAIYGFIFSAGLFPVTAHRFLSPFHQPFSQPFQQFATGLDIHLLLSLMVLFLALSIPFVFVGAIQAVVFKEHGERSPRLYLADLAGAAAGGLVFIPLIQTVGAPRGLAVVSVIAAFGFLIGTPKRFFGPSLLILIPPVIAVLAGPVPLPFARGRYEPNLLMEEWNAFSRVVAYRRLPGESAGAWGISRYYAKPLPDQLSLLVDDTGYTVITRFGGDVADLDYMKADIISLGHTLFESGKTLIIGPGGGRDILAALAYDHLPIEAVELNPLIVEAVTSPGRFGDFAGHLEKIPGVKLVVDEGRGYVSRSPNRYRLIQASLLYGQTGPSAGAFTLTENNLYSLEAFRSYLEHLDPEGVISISRFHREPQTIRLITLATQTLSDMGAQNPPRHIFIAAERGLATILISKDPLSNKQIEILEETCRRWGFNILYSPQSPGLKNQLAQAVITPDWRSLSKKLGIDLSPPTDNRPFFYYLTPPKDFFSLSSGKGFADRAVTILKLILFSVLIMSVGLLSLPAVISTLRPHRPPWGVNLYAAGCGLGYIMIEIFLIKSFTVFLGLPTYSLVVTTVGLLTASSLGSGWSKRWAGKIKGVLVAVAMIMGLSLFLLSAAPPVLKLAFPLPLWIRIVISLVLIGPLGFVMGIPYPLLLARCAGLNSQWIPWAWAVNGTFSVLGAMLALTVAMNAGFPAVLGGGIAAYGLVLLSVFLLLKADLSPGGSPPGG